MSFARRQIKQVVRAIVRVADRTREPILVNRDRIWGLETVHGVLPTALLQVTGHSAANDSHLKLGPNVWIGERVEIEAVAPGSIEIGENTSLQHDCIVRGAVTIGANCIFARASMVMSTTHHFRDMPEWLITDQDSAFWQNPQEVPEAAITIGEDCWFGACSAVMPGVTIGRGAIIGANTVVTRDIGPYEIHGGAPNRQIGRRLAFAPPSRIDAMSDQHIPYFYKGFQLTQKVLSMSRQQKLVLASDQARIVLASATGKIALSGRLLHGGALQIRTRINNGIWQSHQITDAQFELLLDAGSPTKQTESLRDFTVIDLQTDRPLATPPAYGLSEAAVIA